MVIKKEGGIYTEAQDRPGLRAPQARWRSHPLSYTNSMASSAIEFYRSIIKTYKVIHR
ncbi:hypothetical protein PCASD_01925 [Puccinia coronata f. sp. avenae]|uniref:Uncharacterized protein n=1 Tax=Puccinia coronata f. sp. avenae TaxID=200324 RepID=A0A2N5VHN2_9BASI|nr:hypothetical protein PCASD_01925 [Puccinia coronata f. sp. avenae]